MISPSRGSPALSEFSRKNVRWHPGQQLLGCEEQLTQSKETEICMFMVLEAFCPAIMVPILKQTLFAVYLILLLATHHPKTPSETTIHVHANQSPNRM
jgi:hypothetical protein